MTGQNSLKPHQSAFVIACIASVALWFLPFLRWFTVPLQYLNTLVHESWHALTALGTGGLVSHIEVHANGNGETYTAGGSNLLISSMGYIGASLLGAAMIAFAHTPRAARNSLVALSAVLALVVLLWVRRDPFGVVSGMLWVVSLWLMAKYLDDEKQLFAAQFLGVQQCLNAIQSLFFLVQISGFGVKQSDAGNMQQFTGIPAILWAAMWCGLSLVAMFYALKISWRTSAHHEPESVL